MDTPHLEKALCYDYTGGDDPVLVVVRVPRNCDSILEKSRVVILDTPGLDSAKSNWTVRKNSEEQAQSDYNWILEATDMAVFVQSSVSALNSTAAEVLKHLRDDQKETWLVHNEMRAKYWRTDDSLAPLEKSQKEEALKVFEAAGFDPKKIRPLTINLGKAYDAMPGFSRDGDFKDDYKNVARLKDESQISTFEYTINEFLKKNGESIRRKHCEGLVEKRVKRFKEAFQNGMACLKRTCEGHAEANRKLLQWKSEVKNDYGERFRVNVKEVKIVMDSLTDRLFREKFSVDKTDYDEADIVAILSAIQKDLPEALKGALSDAWQHIRVVSENGNSMELNDYVDSQFEEFRKIKKVLHAEGDRDVLINDAGNKLLVSSTKDDLLMNCKEGIPAIKDEQCDIHCSVANAAKDVTGYRKLKTLGCKKYFYCQDALTISSSCKEAFCKIEENWKESVSRKIEEWWRNEFPRKLLCKFNGLLDDTVSVEVNKRESIIKKAHEQIDKLTPIEEKIDQLKI